MGDEGRVQGLGGSGFGVQGLGFRVQSSGFGSVGFLFGGFL